MTAGERGSLRLHVERRAWADATDQPFSAECRRLAASVLARKPVAAQRIIRDALGASSEDVRSLALVLVTLTAVAGTPAAGRAALQRLTNGEPDRVAALAWLDPGLLFLLLVEEFGDEGDDDIEDLIDELIERMQDAAPIVRQRAALAFGMLADISVRGLTPLLWMAEEDPDGAAVTGAMLGLWATGQELGVAVVRDAARRDPDWRVRSVAGSLLVELGELDSLQDVDTRVVSAVASVLPNPLGPHDSSQLLRLLRAPSVDMGSRRVAAARLADSGDPDLIDAANEFATRNSDKPELEGFVDELVAAGVRESPPRTSEDATS